MEVRIAKALRRHAKLTLRETYDLLHARHWRYGLCRDMV